MPCCSGDGSVTQITPSSAEKITQKEVALSMTHEAAVFISDLLKKENKPDFGLKIEVMPGGCAGYKYFMALQEKAEKGDKVLEFHGIKVFMSLMSYGLLKGSTIEYVQSLEATGLRVNNPNATRACGCGKSFS